jgi:protein O-GlcNAc transferase
MREFAMGLQLFAEREYGRAARAFHEALVTEPRNARLWAYLGISLAHAGRAEAAEQALRRAVTIAPVHAESWFHLGVARSLALDWAGAATAYRRAAALAPDDLTIWHRLGVALAESGDPSGGATAFERALILSREDGSPPGPSRRLADPLHDHINEPGETEGPKEAESWLSLALSLLTLGDVEEAVAAYEKAYTLGPERARHSSFRPMLLLLTATVGAPQLAHAPGPASPERPTSPTHPPIRPPVARWGNVPLPAP